MTISLIFGYRAKFSNFGSKFTSFLKPKPILKNSSNFTFFQYVFKEIEPAEELGAEVGVAIGQWIWPALSMGSHFWPSQ
jgi:hypothetical protein